MGPMSEELRSLTLVWNKWHPAMAVSKRPQKARKTHQHGTAQPSTNHPKGGESELERPDGSCGGHAARRWGCHRDHGSTVELDVDATFGDDEERQLIPFAFLAR